MKLTVRIVLALLAITLGASAAGAQEIDEAKRTRNREQLASLLDRYGPTVHLVFHQNQKQQYNYVATLTDGLVHSDSFEVVFRVTSQDTYSLRVYPLFKKRYINIDKASNPLSLARQLLRLTDRAFLFWGIDDTGDVFTGYTFTLESGFPEESIRIVLRSIVNSDKFVGEIRSAIE